jgi:hypothetical protein
MTKTRSSRPTWSGIVILCLLCGQAAGQTCDTLAGGSACGASAKRKPVDFSSLADPSPSRGRGGGGDALTPFSGMGGGIGNDLSTGTELATFGAITFSGGSSRCTGLFRSRGC